MLTIISTTVAVPNTFGQTAEGEILASIGFNPKIHGFGFRNFGENPDYAEDLTADDMIRIIYLLCQVLLQLCLCRQPAL